MDQGRRIERIISVFNNAGLPGISTVVVSYDVINGSGHTTVHGIPAAVCQSEGRVPRSGDEITLEVFGDRTEVLGFRTVSAKPLASGE